MSVRQRAAAEQVECKWLVYHGVANVLSLDPASSSDTSRSLIIHHKHPKRWQQKRATKTSLQTATAPGFINSSKLCAYLREGRGSGEGTEGEQVSGRVGSGYASSSSKCRTHFASLRMRASFANFAIRIRRSIRFARPGSMPVFPPSAAALAACMAEI